MNSLDITLVKGGHQKIQLIKFWQHSNLNTIRFVVINQARECFPLPKNTLKIKNPCGLCTETSVSSLLGSPFLHLPSKWPRPVLCCSHTACCRWQREKCHDIQILELYYVLGVFCRKARGCVPRESPATLCRPTGLVVSGSSVSKV